MNTNSREKSYDEELQKSRSRKDMSDRRSLGSIDRLYKAGGSGKVYSEKCLINQKNYLMFQGKKMSLKNISRIKDNQYKRRKVGNLSCDKIENVKSVGYIPNSKSGFFSASHIENFEGASTGKIRNRSRNR